MSSVEQSGLRDTLLDHVGRIRYLERGGSPLIYVGTAGIDGVDDLLTPDSPPFENGWTNSLGDPGPVRFTRLNGIVHIWGGFEGGADGTTIFTLPVGYLPSYQQPAVIPTTDVAHIATVVINFDGTVVFGTTI